MSSPRAIFVGNTHENIMPIGIQSTPQGVQTISVNAVIID
jgi:hypothetical protein